MVHGIVKFFSVFMKSKKNSGICDLNLLKVEFYVSPHCHVFLQSSFLIPFPPLLNFFGFHSSIDFLFDRESYTIMSFSSLLIIMLKYKPVLLVLSCCSVTLQL